MIATSRKAIFIAREILGSPCMAVWEKAHIWEQSEGSGEMKRTEGRSEKQPMLREAETDDTPTLPSTQVCFM